MSDGSGATAWSYDPVGRPLTERRTINGTSAITNNTTYGYNLDGSLATLTYPGSARRRLGEGVQVEIKWIQESRESG